MRIHRLQRETFINTGLSDVWKYFSDPSNLNALTPEDLKFEELDPNNTRKMYAGMIINYRIRPFMNFPMRWTTEITHCEDGKYFIDEQRFGPYAFWHHLHRFEAQENGILMTDTVHYAMPLGFIGNIINALYVRKRLRKIFDFRQDTIKKIFPPGSSRDIS